MDQSNNPQTNIVDSQRTKLSRLFQKCSEFVARVFPSLSSKYPTLSKVIAVLLMSLLVALIYFILTLSSTSCATTTKAVVSNTHAQTTITIRTSQDPQVTTEGSVPITVTPP